MNEPQNLQTILSISIAVFSILSLIWMIWWFIIIKGWIKKP
jgi:TM2 domain-containing membrane protein YozV